ILLKAGATIEQLDYSRSSILNSAAEGGDISTIQFLLDAGAKVDQVSNYGYTPIYNAASKGHIEATRLLLKQPGIRINQPLKNDGITALSFAAFKGYL